MVDAARTVTVLLREWRAGDEAAADELIPLVYAELRRLASIHLAHERPGHLLHPTDLVSEAYLRLACGEQPEWNDRVHFFAIAARTMRQILVDNARQRARLKRGGGEQPITLEEGTVALDRPEALVALDEALVALAGFDQRKARAVELCYFGGLTQEECATVLEVHVNTVARDLKVAEAWIYRWLRSND